MLFFKCYLPFHCNTPLFSPHTQKQIPHTVIRILDFTSYCNPDGPGLKATAYFPGWENMPPIADMQLQSEPIKESLRNKSQCMIYDGCVRVGTAYCLRSSASLVVSPAISLMERRMSSLSLGSSHRSAIRLASASKALMFSSPSGPPCGSASHAQQYTIILLYTITITVKYKFGSFVLLFQLVSPHPAS